MCGRASGSRHDFWLMDYDGANEKFFTRNAFAHSSWLGKTGKLQGCARFPSRAVLVATCGQEHPQLLVQGPYFWHSASTLDGEWIISDTNWPDEGLQLINVSTRRFRTLCYPLSSEGHPQWTHPHPSFSPDGELVLFNSDRTGVAQIYLATIPGEMREELNQGT